MVSEVWGLGRCSAAWAQGPSGRSMARREGKGRTGGVGVEVVAEAEVLEVDLADGQERSTKRSYDFVWLL